MYFLQSVRKSAQSPRCVLFPCRMQHPWWFYSFLFCFTLFYLQVSRSSGLASIRYILYMSEFITQDCIAVFMHGSVLITPFFLEHYFFSIEKCLIPLWLGLFVILVCFLMTVLCSAVSMASSFKLVKTCLFLIAVLSSKNTTFSNNFALLTPPCTWWHWLVPCWKHIFPWWLCLILVPYWHQLFPC